MELTVMLSLTPPFAPTWNFCATKEPSSNLLPLKDEFCATRSISDESACTSASSAARSELVLVALADCTANSRMRCKLLLICAKSPSAVCDREMPSLALRAAWLAPLICEVIRSLMAKPAASSLALLMRRPLDRRCMEVDNEAWLCMRLRCAVNELMFVLITDIWKLLVKLNKSGIAANPNANPKTGRHDRCAFKNACRTLSSVCTEARWITV